MAPVGPPTLQRCMSPAGPTAHSLCCVRGRNLGSSGSQIINAYRSLGNFEEF